MKLVGDYGTLILERSELGAPGTPADKDILLNITVESGGFAASDQSWITGQEWVAFLSGIQTLELRRRGVATLIAASPEDLRIEFFSTDAAGHMAVRGQVRRSTMEEFELKLQFGFAFSPDELPRVLRELQEFDHS
jgi:hypothetical protein